MGQVVVGTMANFLVDKLHGVKCKAVVVKDLKSLQNRRGSGYRFCGERLEFTMVVIRLIYELLAIPLT